MLEKKSMVLTSASGGQEKAVLSMECDKNMLTGRVRLYNFGAEPKGIISLGIFDQNKVVKAGLTKVSSMLFSFQTESASMPQNFSCAVVNFVGGKASPILYGVSDGSGEREEVFDTVISALQGVRSAEETEKVLDDYQVDYDDEEKEVIAKALDKEFDDCSKCDGCKYKKYYLSHFSALSEEEEKREQLPEEQTFFDEIRAQVESIFEKNPPEEYLQNLIPDSKWAKVKFEESGDYYVFGLIYEDEQLKYVCYGVPGVYQEVPPRELSGYPVWFPLDEDKKDGFGYWLTYQDAKSGESVRAIVE